MIVVGVEIRRRQRRRATGIALQAQVVHIRRPRSQFCQQLVQIRYLLIQLEKNQQNTTRKLDYEQTRCLDL